MSNLPLKVLPWNAMHTDDKRIFVEHAQGAGVFYTVYGAVDSEFGTRWHDQMEGSHGKKEGFESIEEAKHWIATDHYPSKMQPYIKPSPTWISVDDRLPDSEGFYMVYVFDDHRGENVINILWWNPDHQQFLEWDFMNDVTHWMPLPDAPSIKEDDCE